jgi:hypothetical protein
MSNIRTIGNPQMSRRFPYYCSGTWISSVWCRTFRPCKFFLLPHQTQVDLEINFTHLIDELSFGEYYPSINNPLDFTHEIADESILPSSPIPVVKLICRSIPISVLFIGCTNSIHRRRFWQENNRNKSIRRDPTISPLQPRRRKQHRPRYVPLLLPLTCRDILQIRC